MFRKSVASRVFWEAVAREGAESFKIQLAYDSPSYAFQRSMRRMIENPHFEDIAAGKLLRAFTVAPRNGNLSTSYCIVRSGNLSRNADRTGQEKDPGLDEYLAIAVEQSKRYRTIRPIES